jgi:hypothetical protein
MRSPRTLPVRAVGCPLEPRRLTGWECQNPDMFRQMVQKITRVVEDRVKPPER